MVQWVHWPHDPRDQQASLPENYWAEVGPGPLGSDRWTWAVMKPNGDGVASGLVADEAAAKGAVDGWVEKNLPYR